MSNIKMYNFNPQPKGLTLPDGFTLTKFKGEEDIADWLDICFDGLIDKSEGEIAFQNRIVNENGPDPYRDIYFIEKDSKKVATFTIVPDMWNSGMGYIHMVACRKEYRGLGLGKFIADISLAKLKEIGKERIFLLTRDNLIPAISIYIGAGFLPVNYIDDEGKDMVERWQKIVNTLGIKKLTILDNDGNFFKVLKCENVNI